MAFRFNGSGSCLCLPFSLLVLHSQLLLAQQPTHRRWVFFMEQTQVQSPAVDSDGTIYIGTGRGDQTLRSDGVYAVNPDGTQKWKLTLGKSVHSSIALDRHDERLLLFREYHNIFSWARSCHSVLFPQSHRWSLLGRVFCQSVE